MTMEKLLKPYDKECMKMAMLKHEEAFRQQVYELHRLYQIQKILMKDIAKKTRNDRPEARLRLDLERPAENEETDLELTLGLSNYHHRKIKSAERASSGPGFSSSSTTESLSRQKWSIESNQDRLNNPPWLFHELSLNMT
ncbi:hypothetical protein ACJIZ3_008003 [Penstemon smallii]|uniref:Uncharacterized protein n=1 Tax=Penstemon smallii TaxID=265156 RepID=A0ABD3T8J3_9LAMI